MVFHFKKILGEMSLACILAVSSCSDDNQMIPTYGTRPDNVPVSVYEDFRTNFPEAENPFWTVDGGYAVVTFSASRDRSGSVWYDLQDAKKKMQRRTIDFSELPEAVRDALAESDYADWEIGNTVDLISRYTAGTVETIYALRAKEISEGTFRKAVLYYTTDGILVKLTVETIYDETCEEIETDYRDWLPQTPPDYATAYIERCYPGAEYLYIHVSREKTVVKILDGRVARTLTFDTEGSWLSTRTEIRVEALPEAVLAAFATSSYAPCRIDKAEEYITASEGTYYLLTIKDEAGTKRQIRIDENGDTEDDSTDNPPVSDKDEDKNKGYGDDDSMLSQTGIDAFIRERYPNAVVTDKKYNEKSVAVEIAYNGSKIRILFIPNGPDYEWVNSEWDLDCHDETAVPAPVGETIARKYTEYRLYFLKYIETANESDRYEAGLRSDSLKKDIKVSMDAQGNVLAEYEKRQR